MRTHVLAYHDVVRGPRHDKSGFAGPTAARYKLDWPRFVEHLDRIDQKTARAPDTFDELLTSQVRPGSWAITFDDGGSSALEIGDELARRGWRGHFFVTTDYVGQRCFLGADEIRALRSLGQVIGSHSCTHRERMSSMSWAEIIDEWRRSTELLSEMLGEAILTASVPGGYYSGRVAGAAAATGLRALYTSEPQSRVRSVDGCFVIGRYMVHRDVDSGTAADLAAGRWSPGMQQRAFWTAKKTLRRLAPRLYLRTRHALRARGR
jgi:peptidoglycan/xylan/chitin deacetylase (PgdA/CDA1 family)